MNSALAKLNLTVVRNLSALSLHKLAQVAGLVVTVALLPRLFGAEMYGQFAFVLSLSYLGQILGDFGTLDVLGKFTPTLSPPEQGRLYSQHLVFKLWVGLLCGAITAGAALLLVDWMEPLWALLAGASVWVHIVAWVPFHLTLGLNRVGTWMFEQAWRQWVLLLLLLALLPWWALSGALLALLLMELIFLGLGCWLVRAYWQPAALRLDWAYLRPYLRFGLGFFLANLMAVALYRSGPLLVELVSGQSTETGYFNLALGLFMLAYMTTSQFAQSLIPTLSNFYSERQFAKVSRWLNNFVRSGWLLSWLGLLLVWAGADWLTPLVFGPEFGPASAAFRWISLGMPPAVLLWAAGVTATVAGQGRLKFFASLLGLILFVGLTLWWGPAYGAAGAALALAAAVTVNSAALLLAVRNIYRPAWGFLAWSGSLGAVLLLGLAWLVG